MKMPGTGDSQSQGHPKAMKQAKKRKTKQKSRYSIASQINWDRKKSSQSVSKQKEKVDMVMKEILTNIGGERLP